MIIHAIKDQQGSRDACMPTTWPPPSAERWNAPVISVLWIWNLKSEPIGFGRSENTIVVSAAATGTSPRARTSTLFSRKNFQNFDIIILSFVFDNYYWKKIILQPSTIIVVHFSTLIYKTRNLTTSKYQNCLFFHPSPVSRAVCADVRAVFPFFSISPNFIAREK